MALVCKPLEKEVQFESLKIVYKLIWLNLFYPLFTCSAAEPEKHLSTCLIWIKRLILLEVK